ncbi:BLUF domain-containing protein [uncultured Jannaschia sp.]|uniref:BLUF domain-containing protein n=1 Tax=uncultured Jannaschia sp. TaxID=293347 RepID=UPI0026072905|nr:BLUF domain-containing protein [uncultured Jannaschia sp.]
MFGYWIYISEAVSRLRSVEDGLIYLSARARNRKLGLTGYLHRVGLHYAQYIEGPVGNLDKIEAMIRSDWRHRDIRTLERGTRRFRLFDGWDMAFAEITPSAIGHAGEGGPFHAPLVQLDAKGLIDMMADAIDEERGHDEIGPRVTVNRPLVNAGSDNGRVPELCSNNKSQGTDGRPA